MSKRRQSITSGVLGKRLSVENFDALTFTLVKWRQDPAVRLMDAKQDEGRILNFVKGLRLSAQVAYLAREILSGEDPHVSWGHLVDESGESCSPECDVIIHRPGVLHQWNGTKQPIMDFNFIECSKALAVISCKSSLESIDKAYCKCFAKYNLRDILLFAECCPSHRTDALRKQALDAGYRGLYYLYTLAKDGFTWQQDETIYIEFVDAIRKLASASRTKKTARKRGSTRRKKMSGDQT